MSHQGGDLIDFYVDSVEVEKRLRLHDLECVFDSTVSGILERHYVQPNDNFFHQFSASVPGASFEVYMPASSGVSDGRSYLFWNDTDKRILINDGASGFLVSAARGSRIWISNLSNSSLAGEWIWFVVSKSSFQGTAPVLFNYGGNAGTGRWLEIYAGEDSLGTPFFVPVASTLLAMTVQTSSLSTSSIGIFLLPDTVNALYTISLSSQNSIAEVELNVAIPANSLVSLRVTSGSMNKPRGSIYLTSA